jgi:hypothetical protein
LTNRVWIGLLSWLDLSVVTLGVPTITIAILLEHRFSNRKIKEKSVHGEVHKRGESSENAHQSRLMTTSRA